jgi:muconate cycloisomerase
VSAIAGVEAFAVRLPLRAAFATSRAAVGTPASGRILVLVRLVDGAGRAGWGEAGPIPGWSPETPGSVLDAVRRHLAPAVTGLDPADVAGLHAAMDGALAPGRGRGMPIAKAAIDLAAHDLVGRRLGVPLWQLLGRRGLPAVRLSWTVLGDGAASVREGLAAGFRHFNVKVGLGIERDAALVRLVRRLAGRSAFLWADANGGYAPHEGRAAARALAAAGADVLEQPLPPHALLPCQQLVADGALPIALDEGITAPCELAEAAALRALDLAVLKVTRTGGLGPSRGMGELALAHGLGLLSSGLTDGALAFAANVALAAAFAVARPCALNGPQLLGADVASVLPRDGDTVRAPEGPGLGVEVDEERVARYRLPW